MEPVKVYQNVLDPNLIKQIKEHGEKQVGNTVWRNSYSWPEGIRRFTSPVLIMDLESFRMPLQDRYRKLKKEWKDLEIDVPRFYAWPPGSYIGWHNDAIYKFASFIYLNEKWDIDHGGLFLYNNNKKIIGIPPVYNQCILSSHAVPHTISRTTPDAPIRMSIQIFGKIKETTTFYAGGGQKRKRSK